MFDIKLNKHRDNLCLIGENDSYTYKEVDELCKKLEAFLPFKKSLILVKAKTNIETIVGYLSLLRLNHAFIMLDSSINRELLNNIMETYRPNYIWEEVDKSYDYLYTFKTYGLRVNSNRKHKLNNDLSLMLSTSGTTGSPKMVKLTKKNIYANCDSIVEYLKIDSSHKAITNLPLYYSYGLSVINTHLAQGAAIVVTDKSILSKEFWEIFKNNSVTTLNGVPYNYEVFRIIGLMKMDLPSLKYMTQAGGKLNQKLVIEYAKWSKDKNIDFYVMYGQTEATARISYLPPKNNIEKSNSIGIPIPNGKLYLKDLNSDEIIEENYKDGELIYQGDNVMLGYATSLEDLSQDGDLEGILHTGDVAHKDEDGYFYITGRLKRFIKIHGNRVGLDEIEQFLKSNNLDALCTGIDNKLMIATTNESIVENIKNIVTKHYALHHSVIKVKKIEQYPVTSAGKIQYQEIIKEFE